MKVIISLNFYVFVIFSFILTSSGIPAQTGWFWSKGWEERFEKDQPTEVIMDSLGVKSGMVIAEIGAGNGRVAVKMANRAGNSGKVYANDIDNKALEFMRNRIKKENIKNMEVIKGRVKDPLLPEKKIDIIYVINTYHHFTDPVSILKNSKPALKKDGRFVIIEHCPEKSGYSSQSCTSKEEILKHVRQAGYKLIKILDFLQKDYIYILQKQN